MWILKQLTSFVFDKPGDVARVNGQLAVSRAFGDKNLKSHLRSDPDITSANMDSNTEILILASDGLWKVSRSPLLPQNTTLNHLPSWRNHVSHL